MNTWPKCPKCHSKEVEIIEIWDATIIWLPGNPYDDKGDLEPGDAKRVKGHCTDCNHHWTFRGIIQVKPEWFEESA